MNDQVILTSSSQLGVGVPLGVCEKLTEGMQNFKTTQKSSFGYNFCFGGTQRVAILIWG
jgi:hypothetical protein